MLGYVTIAKSELKIKEYDVYQGYYCGICKAIGKRCGQLPRLTLSYDSVFLAMVLAGLDDVPDEIEAQHCIVHPIKKKPVVLNQKAIDYAADVMVILAYHKFLDDWKDERSPLGLTGKTALGGAYRKLSARYPEVCRQVETALASLSALEAQKCGSLDLTANAFADVMEPLFTGYLQEAGDTPKQRILAQTGRALGRWIYVIDALDDYAKDLEKGSYNPLVYRKNQLEGTGDLLYNYLAEIMNAYDLLEIKKNKAIIENIIFMGLRLRTDTVLKERETDNEQSI
ncbi:MAG: hypothetical protein IKJ77_09470 [Firmicutes bacterium]|nr:hypothetical protein [Bacillota bacterium]